MDIVEFKFAGADVLEVRTLGRSWTCPLLSVPALSPPLPPVPPFLSFNHNPRLFSLFTSFVLSHNGHC